MKKKNLLGEHFGRLTVIGEAKAIKGKAIWRCICSCGVEKNIMADHLLRGAINSCGCYKKEIMKKTMAKLSFKHGDSRTILYRKYRSMLSRCNDPNNRYYKRYGGRGIKVCKEWEKDFVSFKNWALKNGYVEGLSIERIDNNKGYSPDNCKFITLAEQQKNKSNNVKIHYKGETKILAEWARIFNINSQTIATRIKRGWSVEKALLTPVRR